MRGQGSAAAAAMGEAYLVQRCLLPKGGLLRPDEGYEAADVLIRGGRIETIASAGSALPDDCVLIDGADKLLLPGLHNAHTHSNNFFSKGGIAPLPLELMVATRVSLPPDHPTVPRQGDDELIQRYSAGAAMTALSTLLSGGTSLIDMITLPEGEELAMRCLTAAADSYRASGIRCFLGPHLNDAADGTFTPNFMGVAPPGCVLPEGLQGLGEDGALRTERRTDPARTAAALAFWRRAIEELHRPEEGMSIILAPHNEATCSAELFSGAAAIMEENEVSTTALQAPGPR